MSEIVIRKDSDKWVAFFNDKPIAKSGCRNCVVHVVLAVTKQSSKYSSIKVLNEDGSVAKTLQTGLVEPRTGAGSLD